MAKTRPPTSTPDRRPARACVGCGRSTPYNGRRCADCRAPIHEQCKYGHRCEAMRARLDAYPHLSSFAAASTAIPPAQRALPPPPWYVRRSMSRGAWVVGTPDLAGEARGIRYGPEVRDIANEIAACPDESTARQLAQLAEDARVLDAVAAVLHGREWDAEDLESVAALVRQTGRTIGPPAEAQEEESPWPATS